MAFMTVTSILFVVGEYFTVADCNTLHIWQRLGKLQQCKENMEAGVLLVELCLCAPFSNAKLERFFNHLKYVKSGVRHSLTQCSLNSLLFIKMLSDDISITCFSEELSAQCVEYWYNNKDRRLHQSKRKAYKQRAGKQKKGVLSFDSFDSSDSD